MGGSFEAPSSSFSCEMSILQAKNMKTLDPTSSGRYFVRIFLSAGKDRFARLETREVPLFDSALRWNESFALQCSGSEESIEWMKHQTLTFELRHRNKALGLRRFLGTGSKLLGRVEAPWKEVFESPHLGIDTWAKMVHGDSRLRGCNDVPSLRIALKLSVDGELKGMMMKKGREEKARNYYECCCDDCNGYISTLDYYDVFASLAAIDAF